MEYTKTFKERDELLDELVTRGMEVVEREKALTFLTRVGYFRSGAYRYVLRQPLPPDKVNVETREFRTDAYIRGASFAHLEHLESFDSKLARVCLDGLLDFEVRLRASIAHVLAQRDVAAHSSPLFLDAQTCARATSDGTKFDAWTRTCRSAIASASEKEDFIAHHLQKYPAQEVPIWAVTEALSFGDLPYLFDLMKSEDARRVAKEFGFNHPRVFGAIVRMMSDFRNVCAHGARLFNRAFKRPLSVRPHETSGSLLDHVEGREFTATPKPQQRLYIYSAVLAFMLRSHSAGTNWHMTFKTQARKLDIDLLAEDGSVLISRERNMGFPRGWETLPLWQRG